MFEKVLEVEQNDVLLHQFGLKVSEEPGERLDLAGEFVLLVKDLLDRGPPALRISASSSARASARSASVALLNALISDHFLVPIESTQRAGPRCPQICEKRFEFLIRFKEVASPLLSR